MITTATELTPVRGPCQRHQLPSVETAHAYLAAPRRQAEAQEPANACRNAGEGDIVHGVPLLL